MANEDNVARVLRDTFDPVKELESEASWKALYPQPNQPIMSAKAAASYRNVLEQQAAASPLNAAAASPVAVASPVAKGKAGKKASPPPKASPVPAPGSPLRSVLMLAPGAAPSLAMVLSPAAKMEAAAALRRATAVSSLSCTGCGSMSVVASLGASGRVLSSTAPDLARRSGGCGLQCLDCSCDEIGNACGGVLFGRRLEVVRTVLVDMSVQARASEIDKEMAGLDREVEVVAETTRLKEQLKDLKWKYSDVRRELGEAQVTCLAQQGTRDSDGEAEGGGGGGGGEGWGNGRLWACIRK